MKMWIDGDTIIRAAAILGSILAIGGAVVAVIKFVIRIKAEEKNNTEQLHRLQKRHNEDVRLMNQELTIISYAQLACLRALKDKGGDESTEKAIDDAMTTLEKHLNQKAHEQGGLYEHE